MILKELIYIGTPPLEQLVVARLHFTFHKGHCKQGHQTWGGGGEPEERWASRFSTTASWSWWRSLHQQLSASKDFPVGCQLDLPSIYSADNYWDKNPWESHGDNQPTSLPQVQQLSLGDHNHRPPCKSHDNCVHCSHMEYQARTLHLHTACGLKQLDQNCEQAVLGDRDTTDYSGLDRVASGNARRNTLPGW